MSKEDLNESSKESLSLNNEDVLSYTSNSQINETNDLQKESNTDLKPNENLSTIKTKYQNVYNELQNSDKKLDQLEKAIEIIQTHLKTTQSNQHNILKEIFDTQTKSNSYLRIKLEHDEHDTENNLLIMETNLRSTTKIPVKFFQNTKN